MNYTGLADYHTHTPLCMHAEGEPEEFIAKAIQLGLGEYGIADHAPALPEPFDDWRMLQSQLPEYWDWIDRARVAAGDRISVKVGMECDWLKGCESWISELKELYPWDYLIGSVHYIADKWDFDNPAWLGKWKETNVEEVWATYWETYETMVKSELFEIHAHPDLIKKFGYRPTGDLTKYYLPTVEALSCNNSTIEINTAGWHKPCEEQYPAVEFLRLCADAKVDLIISSDAHAPEEVGRGFTEAVQIAKSAGFTTTVRFSQGRKEVIPL